MEMQDITIRISLDETSDKERDLIFRILRQISECEPETHTYTNEGR
jgi:hypothetical protein